MYLEVQAALIVLGNPGLHPRRCLLPRAHLRDERVRVMRSLITMKS